jgi:hypothetical protein
MEKKETAKELVKRAYKLGFEYEEFYRGCSQEALGAIYDTLNMKDDGVFKAATGFAGGAAFVASVSAADMRQGVLVISHSALYSLF